MSDAKLIPVPGVRVIAFVLIAGGLFGLIVTLAAYVNVFLNSGLHVTSLGVFFGLSLLAFGWSVWTGIDLWRGRPQAYTWAKVLFAAQVPAIMFPGFAYRFEVFGFTIG